MDSVDLAENEAAHSNVLVADAAKWEDQAEAVLSAVSKLVLESGTKYDAIVCAAGGWQGGSASASAFIRSCDAMWRQSVWSSTIAARIASLHLLDGGTLVLIGASAALDATPGMIGYGMAKAAVHHLVHSLAHKGGLPTGAFVAAMCPVTLDTPANRAAMAQADTSTWTPLNVVAARIHEWIEGRQRPPTGSLVRVVTQASETEFIPTAH